ncbi:MAG: T9SS type A sorting domain-containing protein [Calditrichaceae bacterium]|nr:T9SS type A sorting domain-containing protein [Calditrichaceae bacterium]
MRFIFSLIICSLFIISGRAQNFQGFFLDDWQAKDALTPSFTDTIPPTDDPANTITINAADTITRIPKYIYGNNANVWSTRMHDNPKLMTNIRNMNPHVLRYPGGSLSDVFFWNHAPGDTIHDIPETILPDDASIWYGRNEQSWTMSVDNFYRFLDSTGCEALISVNYAYARYGTSENPVNKAAHYAAEWVRYDNGRTRFWTIGNENYGDWEAGYEIDTALNQDGQPQYITGSLYGQHALVFIDSMKAAAAEIGHTIYIGVEAYDAETSYTPVQTYWNENMMPITGNIVDFYSVHSYYTPYNENSTVSTILNSYTKTSSFKSTILKDLSDAGYDPVPVALTEWNIFAIGSMQQVSHINGLHAALVLGEAIKSGYGLAQRWDLANGWDNGNDHGTFARNEPDVELFTPHPCFHHMTWFQRYFGDVMVNAGSSQPTAVVPFASTFNSGHCGLVIVNKSNLEQIIDIDIQHYELGERYYWFTLTGGDDNGNFSRKVYINGIGTEGIAGGPEDYNSINAYSCLLENGLKIYAPPYSAIYMLVEGQTSATAIKAAESTNNVCESISINPNPARDFITINPGKNRIHKIEIFNILGQKVLSTENFRSTAVPARINLKLTPGMYFIRFQSVKGIIAKKMIIF